MRNGVLTKIKRSTRRPVISQALQLDDGAWTTIEFEPTLFTDCYHRGRRAAMKLNLCEITQEYTCIVSS